MTSGFGGPRESNFRGRFDFGDFGSPIRTPKSEVGSPNGEIPSWTLRGCPLCDLVDDGYRELFAEIRRTGDFPDEDRWPVPWYGWVHDRENWSDPRWREAMALAHGLMLETGGSVKRGPWVPWVDAARDDGDEPVASRL